MKKKKIKKIEPVRCWVCEKAYPADIQDNQGFEIASSLYASGVISYFGSEFDGDIHMFYEPIEQDVDDLFTGAYYPICDECIQDLIDRNLIGLVKSTFG
jgi:hypothetical protein